MKIQQDDLILLYRNMVRGRKYDETLIELCQKSRMPGMWHSGVGHEAVQAGVATFLRQDDWLELSHRGITAGLAKGLDARKWLAETLGRSGGYCGGKSRKSADQELGVLPAGGTIGSCFPLATGAGIAAKHAGKGQVVMCLFGDGASQRGTLHECMNMAAVWKLPIIWVCENNQYSITTHQSKALAVENVSSFGKAYGIPGETLDGMDVVAVAEAALRAIERARRGEGPSLIECKTYRFREHGEFDITTSYRTKEEVERWKERDPIMLFRDRLVEDGTATDEALIEIEAELDRETAEVCAWALESPEPNAEQAFMDVFRT